VQSAAHEDMLNTLKDIQSSLEMKAPRLRKEYDDIDASLNYYGIRPDAPWGFVVFRTVYGVDSDARWARMLECLRSTVTECISYADQTELLPRHQLTIIEDPETLSGADSHTVRHAFRAWVADDLTPRLLYPERDGGSERIRSKLRSNDAHDANHPVLCLPPRWNFCLFVDETCLRSLDSSRPYASPTIKILTTDWTNDRVAVVAEGWEDGETDHEFEEVGWMYVDAQDYVEWYNRLDSAFEWSDFYERPYKGYVEG
jgi:hypothetical protein